MAYITKQERSEIMKNIRALLPQGWKAKASNIKDSGSIEQDADLIILITREKSEATLHVVKNRNGATGSVECNFNGNACLFSNEKQYDYEYL